MKIKFYNLILIKISHLFLSRSLLSEKEIRFFLSLFPWSLSPAIFAISVCRSMIFQYSYCLFIFICDQLWIIHHLQLFLWIIVKHVCFVVCWYGQCELWRFNPSMCEDGILVIMESVEEGISRNTLFFLISHCLVILVLLYICVSSFIIRCT